MHIQDILGSKGFEVVSVTPECAVGELVALLGERNLGAVVVSADARHVAGIVSERDVVRHLGKDPDLLSRPVSTIMSSDVQCCAAADSTASVMSLMTERRIRHVPVVDGAGALTGIVSIGDLVKSQISELQFERDQLQEYVLH